MTDWRSYYDPGYLTPEDLGTEGKTATIASIEQGVFPTADEEGVMHDKRNPIVRFAETQTKWRVNEINRQLLEALFGSRAEAAIGHKVTLFNDPCEVKGAFHGKPSVRVKGSPELAAERKVDIKLPRRAPFKRVLMPTGDGAAIEGTTEEVAEDAADAEFLSATETEGKASREQLNRIRGLIKKSGLSETEWRDYAQEVAGTDVVEDMTPDGAAQFVEFLSGAEGRLAVEP